MIFVKCEMKNTRRNFIKKTVGAGLSLTAGLYLLKYFRQRDVRPGFNKLNMKWDALRLCQTPSTFVARDLSRQGERMNDGHSVPGYHDGMGCFAGVNGEIILARNHEVPDTIRTPSPAPGWAYDPDCSGGVTAIKLDKNLNIIDQRLVLSGTLVNCGGGKTPWNTWLTCEENVSARHGYVFEVNPFTKITQAVPLKAMGRFMHEAATVHEATGIVYMTEDRYDGCLYRFLPHQRTKLNQGGILQALRIQSGPPRLGQSQKCDWVTLQVVDSDFDDLRYRAHKLGATPIARGEGIIANEADVYFVATIGGKSALGQIFKLTASALEVNEIELIYEAQDNHLLHNPDQITFNQWGDLIICEDPIGNTSSRILGLTNDGRLYVIANSIESEWSGVCFSPDYKHLFANLQKRGVTYAFSGDWAALRASASVI